MNYNHTYLLEEEGKETAQVDISEPVVQVVNQRPIGSQESD